MHENFLAYHQGLWLKISLALAILLGASYWVYSQSTTPNGRTVVGFLYGVLGLLSILSLMYYGRRKRRYKKNQWSLRGWLSFHCYVGMLTLLIIAMHAGFQWHFDIHTLAFVLLAIVVVSGMVGAVLYLTIPRQFSHFGAELMYVGNNTVDREFHRIQQQIQALSQGKSPPFRKKSEEEQQRGLPTRPVGWRLLFRRTPTATVLATRYEEFQEYRTMIPPGEQEDYQLLGGLAMKKWQLELRLVSQMRLQNFLEAWLYIHLPVSMAMMVAIVVHIVAVFYHGYRVPEWKP